MDPRRARRRPHRPAPQRPRRASTGNQTHIDSAVADFEALRADYDPATGSFVGVTELSTWEVADILGAVNSLRFNTDGVLPRVAAEEVLVGFFEATANHGGLMRAFIPKQLEASPFELERLTNDLYFSYPGMPSTDQAGGSFGSAAGEVAAISFDTSTGEWAVSDNSFGTSGSMHASNEMFWIWGFQSGIPRRTRLTMRRSVGSVDTAGTVGWDCIKSGNQRDWRPPRSYDHLTTDWSAQDRDVDASYRGLRAVE